MGAQEVFLSGDSSMVERPFSKGSDGGSIPTSPLQLRKKDWVVAGCDMETAGPLIQEVHYSKGASKQAAYIHGLYPADWHWYADCVGVAWWIPPTKSAAQKWLPENWEGVLSLSRLAIQPEVPPNACSFLLSKSVKLIDRKRWPVLVTYADTWRGHTGAIYRACGWQFCGMTRPEPTYTINGRMTARKRGDKTRTHGEMMVLGARFEGRFSKSRWMAP